jgi:hypothetical protein
MILAPTSTTVSARDSCWHDGIRLTYGRGESKKARAVVGDGYVFGDLRAGRETTTVL